MTEPTFLLTHLRFAAGEAGSLFVREGLLADPAGAPADVRRIDGQGRLALPSLIEGHVHLDKTFLGCPWQPHLPGVSVAERIAQEKVARGKVTDPVEVRGARLVDRLLERGVGRIRTHVDIDPEWGLTTWALR